MEKKICNKCKEEKDICEFYRNPKNISGHRNTCKLCVNEKQKKYSKSNRENRNLTQQMWREKNTEKVKEYRKKYYDENPEKYKLISKLYRNNHPEQVKLQNKKYYYNNPDYSKKRILDWITKNYDYRIDYMKNWRLINKEKIKTYKNIKYNNDVMYKLIHNVRTRINGFLTTKNITKNNKTFNIIGCNPQELKEYLEKQFVDGMTWENRCKWHIDHKIPLSSAKTEEEIYKLCHYTNLQPLWAKDNIKKSNQII
jgi:hypothetical protein